MRDRRTRLALVRFRRRPLKLKRKSAVFAELDLGKALGDHAFFVDPKADLVGGELKGYTELLTEARRQAIERMLAQAKELGADAVVNVRFTTSAVTAGAAELYAYGTAVTLSPGA